MPSKKITAQPSKATAAIKPSKPCSLCHQLTELKYHYDICEPCHQENEEADTDVEEDDDAWEGDSVMELDEDDIKDHHPGNGSHLRVTVPEELSDFDEEDTDSDDESVEEVVTAALTKLKRSNASCLKPKASSTSSHATSNQNSKSH